MLAYCDEANPRAHGIWVDGNLVSEDAAPVQPGRGVQVGGLVTDRVVPPCPAEKVHQTPIG